MPRYREVPRYIDMPAVLTACPNPDWRNMATAIYYTGARSGEMIQVKVKDVNQDEHNPDFLNITLPTEKNRTQVSRIVPISITQEPEGAALFADLARARPPEELLFNWGDQPTTLLRKMRYNFNHYYAGVAPHYFRHCRLTHLVIKFGYGSHELKQYAGWSDERPARVYVHLRVEDLQNKMVGK